MNATQAPSHEIEWTEHTNTCRGCERRFRICRDAWDMAREDEPSWTEKETVESFEFCLECTTGESTPGEYVDHCHGCDQMQPGVKTFRVTFATEPAQDCQYCPDCAAEARADAIAFALKAGE